MKYVLGIEYSGADYAGWQIQRGVRTVQRELETALSKVANSSISVQCAGRTDSGVNALKQVVHFISYVNRSTRDWVRGCNAYLPADVSVSWCQQTDDYFHARFSAVSRVYRYFILNRPERSGIYNGWITHIRQPLNESIMHEAAQSLVGEFDFSAFRARGCQSFSPIRKVLSIEVERFGDFIIISVEANAFLQKMVRNLSGSLIEVGKGRRPVSWITKVLESRDRTFAASTSKPEGLYLVNVIYPVDFGIPRKPGILFPDIAR